MSFFTRIFTGKKTLEGASGKSGDANGMEADNIFS